MSGNDWLRRVGKLRAILTGSALLVWLSFVPFDPAFHIAEGPLILPFRVLLGFQAIKVLCSSAVMAECIRLFTFRWTQSLSLKRHFVIVLGLAILIGGIDLRSAPARYYNYGWSSSERHDYAKALRSLDIAIAYNPKYATAYAERAYVHRRMGDYGEALADSNRAIELRPNDPSAYVSRGQSYYHLGDYRRAIKEFEKAKSLDQKLTGLSDKWIEGARKNLGSEASCSSQVSGGNPRP